MDIRKTRTQWAITQPQKMNETLELAITRMGTKNDWNLAISNNMNGPRRYYTK